MLLYARLPRVEVGDLALPGIVSLLEVNPVGSGASRHLAGDFGHGFLQRFAVTYDYSHRRLLVEPTAGFDQPDTFSRSGLWLARDGTRWKVTRVLEHGPGAEAGPVVGDQIGTIAGLSSDQLDPAALSKLTRQPAGTRLPVTIRRDAVVRAVDIILRDVL